MADQPSSRRSQFRLRTLVILGSVASVWIWGIGQFWDNGMESHRQWLRRAGLPDDPEFPAPDHLLINGGTVALVMLLALIFGIFLILWGMKDQSE
jgi:hypothetical protein